MAGEDSLIRPGVSGESGIGGSSERSGGSRRLGGGESGPSSEEKVGCSAKEAGSANGGVVVVAVEVRLSAPRIDWKEGQPRGCSTSASSSGS